MSYENPRIKSLNVNIIEIMKDFAEGNPGAVAAMVKIMESAETIDPDNALGALGVLFSLDNLDCYGSNIWLLYKDICKSNVTNVHIIFRAIGFGLLNDKEVRQDIENARTGEAREFDFPELLKKIQEKIPDFAKAV